MNRFAFTNETFISSNSHHLQQNKRSVSTSYDETASDYGSGSPPSCDELLYTPPKLHRRINTNFSNAKMCDTPPQGDRYNFSEQMRDAYLYNVSCKCQKTRSLERSGCESCNGGAWLVKWRDNKDGFVTNDDIYIGIPIWSMDYLDNLIVVGCANGQIEFWEGTTGRLKVEILQKRLKQ